MLFSGLDGIQQEIAVVFAVLLHGHALIGRHEHLLPEFGIFRQERVFPLQQLLVQSERILGGFRLAGHGGAVSAHIRLLVVVLCAAGCKGEQHHRAQHQSQYLLYVHIRFSLSFVVVFSQCRCVFFLFSIAEAVAEAHGVRRTGTDTHPAADALGMVGRFRHIHVHLAGSGAFPTGDALTLVHLHLEKGHPVEQGVERAQRA